MVSVRFAISPDPVGGPVCHRGGAVAMTTTAGTMTANATMTENATVTMTVAMTALMNVATTTSSFPGLSLFFCRVSRMVAPAGCSCCASHPSARVVQAGDPVPRTFGLLGCSSRPVGQDAWVVESSWCRGRLDDRVSRSIGWSSRPSDIAAAGRARFALRVEGACWRLNANIPIFCPSPRLVRPRSPNGGR